MSSMSVYSKRGFV